MGRRSIATTRRAAAVPTPVLAGRRSDGRARVLLAPVALLVLAAACEGDQAASSTTTTTATAADTTSTTTDGDATTDTSAPDASSTTTASTTTTSGGDGADADVDDEGPIAAAAPGDVQSEGFPAGGTDVALLTDVRTGAHEGFDRVVLEFSGDARPAYRVGYVDAPVRADGSGHVVDVAGSSQLEVRVTPARTADLSGGAVEPTYEGPLRFSPPGTEVVRELVRTGDFEAQLAWVVGVDDPVPFAVALLDDPVRLVIDLVHDEPPADG